MLSRCCVNAAPVLCDAVQRGQRVYLKRLDRSRCRPWQTCSTLQPVNAWCVYVRHEHHHQRVYTRTPAHPLVHETIRGHTHTHTRTDTSTHTHTHMHTPTQTHRCTHSHSHAPKRMIMGSLKSGREPTHRSRIGKIRMRRSSKLIKSSRIQKSQQKLNSHCLPRGLVKIRFKFR